jgi:hypothetical protein
MKDKMTVQSQSPAAENASSCSPDFPSITDPSLFLIVDFRVLVAALSWLQFGYACVVQSWICYGFSECVAAQLQLRGTGQEAEVGKQRRR